MPGPLRQLWLRVRTDPPRVDVGQVGVTFVDVLFALVVGYAITPLQTWWKISTAGWFDLSVAATLTLTSWIGYHNSVHRPKWVISFPNYPLAVFVLDISMVVVYGLSVFSANTITQDASQRATPLPEAAAVAASFLLYVLWDWVNLLIQVDDRYKAAWAMAKADGIIPQSEHFPKDSKGRRKVTWLCLGVAALLFCYAFHLNEVARLSTASSAFFDVALVALLLFYRLAKEWVIAPA